MHSKRARQLTQSARPFFVCLRIRLYNFWSSIPGFDKCTKDKVRASDFCKSIISMAGYNIPSSTMKKQKKKKARCGWWGKETFFRELRQLVGIQRWVDEDGEPEHLLFTKCPCPFGRHPSFRELREFGLCKFRHIAPDEMGGIDLGAQDPTLGTIPFWV